MAKLFEEQNMVIENTPQENSEHAVETLEQNRRNSSSLV